MLQNEIWTNILKYLDYVDILSIKFLSKRCLNIIFLNNRFKYFQDLAKQLVDCNLFYQKINAFVENFVQKVKSDISLSNCLYLNYYLHKALFFILDKKIFCLISCTKVF